MLHFQTDRVRCWDDSSVLSITAACLSNSINQSFNQTSHGHRNKTDFLTSRREIDLRTNTMPSIPRYFNNATPHQKPLMPRDESTSLESLRKSSPCNSRSASLDRVKKTNYLHWRADRARSASVGGDTLIPDTEPEEVDELWKCIRKEKVLSMSSEKSRLPVRKASERFD